MKKTPAIVKKELQLTIALVIAATILSHISLPFFDHANFHIGIIIKFILNADALIPLLAAPLIINFFFTAIAAGGFFLIMNFRKN